MANVQTVNNMKNILKVIVLTLMLALFPYNTYADQQETGKEQVKLFNHLISREGNTVEIECLNSDTVFIVPNDDYAECVFCGDRVHITEAYLRKSIVDVLLYDKNFEAIIVGLVILIYAIASGYMLSREANDIVEKHERNRLRRKLHLYRPNKETEMEMESTYKTEESYTRMNGEAITYDEVDTNHYRKHDRHKHDRHNTRKKKNVKRQRRVPGQTLRNEIVMCEVLGKPKAIKRNR